MNVKVHGHCDERFAAVKEAFQSNFDSGQEVGASFAATIDGKFVVDIWGGYADAAQTRPWERDTIVNVFSTTKVMTALCALMLVDRGQLDLDAPVAKYWPEFAQAGKERLPVRYLLSHQAGLAAFNEPLTLEMIYNWSRAVNLLAAQKPMWEPGTANGYHATTFGYLVGEVIRRITNKSVGTFFREEVAGPLKADFHIGLPEEYDYRVAEMISAPMPKPGEPGFVRPDPNSLFVKVLLNPPLPEGAVNTRAWRGAEIPAANGHGNARSVAKVGAVIACGGKLDGILFLGLPTIEKAIQEQCYRPDLVLGIPVRYGLGFGINSKEMPHGPNPRTVFWSGAGGSRVIMDLDARLSCSYVMNKMSSDMMDPRGPQIAKALYAALA